MDIHLVGVFSKKLILFQLVLLLFTIVACLFQYNQVVTTSKKQDVLTYYINISGKQRILAQRIVFLSQVIATNQVLHRDNFIALSELRDCIIQLNSIHEVLQNFVVSVVLTKKEVSTLGDIYFGSGNLSLKIPEFLEEANKILIANDTNIILQINQNLLYLLEGDNGLLNTLELATLSNQLYAQNYIKLTAFNNKLFLSFIGILILIEFFILLRIFLKKD